MLVKIKGHRISGRDARDKGLTHYGTYFVVNSDAVSSIEPVEENVSMIVMKNGDAFRALYSLAWIEAVLTP